MTNNIVRKRISELKVELDWIDYNLQQVGNISTMLAELEVHRKLQLLGKKHFSSGGHSDDNIVKSDYNNSIIYNRDAENNLIHAKNEVIRRIKIIENLIK